MCASSKEAAIRSRFIDIFQAHTHTQYHTHTHTHSINACCISVRAKWPTACTTVHAFRCRLATLRTTLRTICEAAQRSAASYLHRKPETSAHL